MISERMAELGKVRSVIRDIFEYGNQRKAEIGEDKVFDFSLGNPSVPAPPEVNQVLRELLDTREDIYLHGYTSAQGDAGARQAIAENLNARYGTAFRADNLYLTCGAAASLKISMTALYTPGDEFITFAPYFPEYRVFAETAGAKLVTAMTDPETFQIDFSVLEPLLNPHTKAVIVNSPNNPSGVVFREESIRKLAGLLDRKQKEYGHAIYILCDEPYRELIYDEDIVFPFMTKYYANTIICYSFSKSLSLPGERIGYILIPDEASDSSDLYAAVCGAGRALGYVCAPSLMQHMVEKCCGLKSDLSVYRENRDLLYGELTGMGYTCVYPDGAFYLFMKVPGKDASAFCEHAKQHELLLVPADSFGTEGYVRISYCVSTEMIRRSLPAFRKLAEECGLGK